MTAPCSIAQEIERDQDMTADQTRNGWLPFAFAAESLGTAVGGVAFSTGKLQPQTRLIVTGFGIPNGSFAAVGQFGNYLLPGTGRLFLDSFLMLGHFTEWGVRAGLGSA